ncbi:glycosyltransferase involved in cell wall biosynthesis [Celeribacter halophilus]|uniref:Glycosyltransferase involved in cell wall bisynthesis n=2 Tax=Celeribacter halophilus TaxID=576117 RepID=A0A1I3WG28_9RHOB|nr:glycosyltransferase involved in cell wall biosynthesis [Celeribacter halophilus]SFK06664.1 Glycosyltransferase involved in cell wall bisynthesis [Celeribacter halophilus]
MRNEKMLHKNVCVLMPRNVNVQAGGITRVVSYTKREIDASNSPYAFTFIPTRWAEGKILSHVSTLYSLWKFLGAIFSEKAEIVHLHVAPKGSTWRKFLFAQIASLFGKPYIIHLHGAGYDEYFANQPRFARNLIQKFYRKAAAVIVLGTGWRAWAGSDQGLGLEPERVYIIDNGVPDPGLRSTHENSVPRIVFVGFVGHRKGVDTLLDALKAVPPDIPWTCAVCGNGEVEKYENLAREKKLSLEQVEFTDWQSEEQVRTQMAASDIHVLPSRAENQPVAILEAMAIGLPSVSSSVGDIPNQIVDGETGYVVPPDDPDALASALEKLLKNNQLRKTMGHAGRKRFEDRYSSKINFKKTLEIYDAISK